MKHSKGIKIVFNIFPMTPLNYRGILLGDTRRPELCGVREMIFPGVPSAGARDRISLLSLPADSSKRNSPGDIGRNGQGKT